MATSPGFFLGEEKDKEDTQDTGDERDIWEVTHVTEEDFETTESVSEDLYEVCMCFIVTRKILGF